jgi:hypothetical protein
MALEPGYPPVFPFQKVSLNLLSQRVHMALTGNTIPA